jgi:hypothetical protein
MRGWVAASAVSMLVVAMAVLAAAQPKTHESNFVYQIFVRSFADSDGVGDLNRIAARLDSCLNDGRPASGSVVRYFGLFSSAMPDHRTEPGDVSRIYDETLREPFPWYRTGAGPVLE